MKIKQESWEKEFDKVWNSDIIKDFIRSLLEPARQEGIEEIYEKWSELVRNSKAERVSEKIIAFDNFLLKKKEVKL